MKRLIVNRCTRIAGFPMYKIGKGGEVFSLYKPKTNKIGTEWNQIQPVLDKGTGYYLVTLVNNGKRKNQFIHRLIAYHFITNPESKPQVNHKDGNKQNNAIDNLEWVTAQENSRHAVDTGLCDARRKAQEVCILQFEKDGTTLVAEHVSLHEAGRITRVHWQNISKVCRGIRHTAGGYHWKYKKSAETIPKGSTLQV